ncbi:MAG: ATP synthase F1 subunit epsilon [Planctomycetes bacterium]|nr:ATP synthase F1 subunit epsilon [Planctomycetota bacterium]
MRCLIRTPARTVFEGEVTSVVFPGADGEIGVLPRHAPMMSVVAPGAVRTSGPGGAQVYAVAEGVAQVLPQELRILTGWAAEGTGLDAAAEERAVAEARTLPRRTEAQAADRSGRLGQARARLRAARLARGR